NFYSSLISLAKPLKAETILDAGCGEGFTMDKLSENGIGKKIEGVEYSKDAMAFGKKLFPHLIIKQGSVYDLPYKDNSFDLIICTEVLEHLEEPTKALREILRVSKKYLIVSVPNEPLFMLSNFLRGKNLLRLGNDKGHINHWTPLSLKRYLTQNKVKVKKIHLPFPWITILGEK
ncbi:MAG: class I SAM-dependent methyltransferase, partial [Candidatus Daviesbacteria bacterium]|nr:class I SAM-dependent methyltransferase [Candidatus Daviesbacteria bacterium]